MQSCLIKNIKAQLKFINILPFICLLSAAATAQNADTVPPTRNSIRPKVTVPDEIFTFKNVSFTMKPVEGGTFWMGAQNKNEAGQNYDDEALNDEKPVHCVTLSDFYIGETEVTQALWSAITHQKPGGSYSWDINYNIGDNYPAYYVSWTDICGENGFLKKLNDSLKSQLKGNVFRLPTEAEWEYAARGGKLNEGHTYSGCNKDDIDDYAWHSGNVGPNNRKPQEVKKKKSNELGIYDMSGNLQEWCSHKHWGSYYQTCFGDGPESDTVVDPQGPDTGYGYETRGGDFTFQSIECRLANRNENGDNSHFATLGFRLVLQPKHPFPVGLLRLRASCVGGNAARISWSTATETNNDYFVVERSTDGTNFVEINRQSGAGTDNHQHDYSFVDRNAIAGNNYYRLTQFDYDGHHSSSDIVVANCNRLADQTSADIRPNPASDKCTLVVNNLNINDLGTAVFAIFDNVGRKVLTREFTPTTTDFETEIDISLLPPAVYNYRLIVGDFVKNGQIIRK